MESAIFLRRFSVVLGVSILAGAGFNANQSVGTGTTAKSGFAVSDKTSTATKLSLEGYEPSQFPGVWVDRSPRPASGVPVHGGTAPSGGLIYQKPGAPLPSLPAGVGANYNTTPRVVRLPNGVVSHDTDPSIGAYMGVQAVPSRQGATKNAKASGVQQWRFKCVDGKGYTVSGLWEDASHKAHNHDFIDRPSLKR